MDRKTISIGILCFTAVALLVAVLMPHQAKGDFAIKDQNFQMITVLGQQGSSTCYVIDNRLGRMAIFASDVRNPILFRTVKVGSVSDLFVAGK